MFPYEGTCIPACRTRTADPAASRRETLMARYTPLILIAAVLLGTLLGNLARLH
jgi:hypothetical protein